MTPELSRLAAAVPSSPMMDCLGRKVRRQFVSSLGAAEKLSDLPKWAQTMIRAVNGEGELTGNVFCPTGPGGGIKPDCKAGAGGSVLTISGVEMKMPTTAKEAAMVRLIYQRERPDVRHQILDSLGIPADKGKPPPPIEQVHKTLQAEMARRANPGSIRDELKNSPHEATRKKVEALNEKWDALEKKYADGHEALRTARTPEERARIEDGMKQVNKDLGALNKEARQLIKDGLKGGVPITDKDLRNVTGADPNGGLNQGVVKAREFLDGIIKPGPDGKGPPPVTTEYGAGGRAQYEAGSQTIYTKMGGGAVAVIHEYGHHLEYRVPGVKEAAQKFLSERVGDEPFTKIAEKYPDAGLRASEKGRKDDFDKTFGEVSGESGHRAYYVGKHYDDGATEVVSMGMEKMYKDPVKFAKQDPEYFNFVMGMLGGEHRGKATGV